MEQTAKVRLFYGQNKILTQKQDIFCILQKLLLPLYQNQADAKRSNAFAITNHLTNNAGRLYHP